MHCDKHVAKAVIISRIYNMSKITIDGKEYDDTLLSDEVKAQLTSMQVVDKKIVEAKQLLAILQTARNAYGNDLKELLAS
jgi:hypothetical protein